MTDKNGTTKYRLSKVEENYKELDIKVDLILTNHLPHINESLASVKAGIKILAVINIGGIIAVAIIEKII